MEDNTFLIIKKSFLQHDDVRILSKSNLFILLDLLFLSFEWHHKPFFRTPEQLYKELNINKMDLSRFREQARSLNISVNYKNQKYYFDLTEFFEIYNPLSNKNVTQIDNTKSNRIATEDDN